MNAISCKSTFRSCIKPAAAPRAAPLAPPQRRHSHRPSPHSSDAATSSPSSWQQLQHTQPAAAAAIVTGVYATLAGLALALGPRTTFGLLFDAAAVPVGWVRVGGVLFTTFGLQYLGAGLGDARLLTRQQQHQQHQQLADAAAAAAPSSAPAPTSSSSFYEASVWSRLFLAAAFAALVAAGAAEPGLLVLAAVNAFGAMSMRAALRKQTLK